jgi:hypothetical protein
MKRLTAILLILCTCITAAACGAKVEEKLPGVTDGISSETEMEKGKETEAEKVSEKETEAETEIETETETEVDDSPKVYKKQDVLEKGTPYTGRFDGEHIGSVATEKGILNVKLTVEYNEITVTTWHKGFSDETVYSCTYTYDPADGKISVLVSSRKTVYEKKFFTGKYIQGKVYLYDGLVHFICTSGQFEIRASDTDTLYFAPVPAREDELTYEMWKSVSEGVHLEYRDSRLFYAIRAFLENDISGFAKFCNVPEEVYECYKGMKISDYMIYSEEFVSKEDPKYNRKFIVVDFEVTESNNDIFKVGKHSLVFDGIGYVTFTPKDEFEIYTEPELSFAEHYIWSMLFEGMDVILEEGKVRRGIASFIVYRLTTLSNNSDFYFTEDEIRDYAEKYLGLDRDYVYIGQNLQKNENGEYALAGGGSYNLVRSTVSAEVRNGITVLTVNYWADYSKTVISRTIEYHLEMLDMEFRPIKWEIIYDSGFNTAYYST